MSAAQNAEFSRAVRLRKGEALLTDVDLHLFNEGTHAKLYDKLGAHVVDVDGRKGTYFAVWAPDAESVHVAGDWNGWSREADRLEPLASSGVFHGVVVGVGEGQRYKYVVRSRFGGHALEKADPFGALHETPPNTASVVWSSSYAFRDEAWMRTRKERFALDAPVSIYEVHLGSFMRKPGEGERSLTYREAAHEVAARAKRLGFTHVELLPIMEHPFYGSWGYQVTGYFAPTSRYGTPDDFAYFVDHLHAEGLGVILDWVPAHFPTDAHGLGDFDGTHLYEHADPRRGFHPDWKSYIFNYGRREVRSFLLSSAAIWLDRFHVDGLRVDGVASMLYLDYSREHGHWIPNEHGGRENLEAISFLKQLNQTLYGLAPDVQTVAEESTAWPGVSRPTYLGGLGFGYKWDMGWMHDTLRYFARDPIHRRHHQDDLTFRTLYAYHENYVLPLSHDEVVHGKGSLIGKMRGDPWQKFANLRLLYAYMYAQPGKKLLFMGAEIAQWREWNHDASLDWHLLDSPEHRAIERFVEALNHLYRGERALHEGDCDARGFSFIDQSDHENSVLAIERRSLDGREAIVAVFNFTPIPRSNYRVGVPVEGVYDEILNSDAAEFGGSGQGNYGRAVSRPLPYHGRYHSVALTLPPLGAIFLRVPVGEPTAAKSR